MSADNGIYILRTLSYTDEFEYEYRVSHLQAIDNIYWNSHYDKMSDEEDLDIHIMNAVPCWKNSEVFYDVHSAYNRALKNLDDVEFTEYGICHIFIDRHFPIFKKFELNELMIPGCFENPSIVDDLGMMNVYDVINFISQSYKFDLEVCSNFEDIIITIYQSDAYDLKKIFKVANMIAELKL